MSLSNELERLAALHARGQLSDEEFSRAKARLLDDEAQRGDSSASSDAGYGIGGSLNALQRSRDDRWLGGVCGGLAQISGLASWIWRLLFIIGLSCGGASVLVYLLLWVVLPEQREPAPQHPQLRY
ncbi:PspC domain-containing protein [Paucibacter sp. APW11]|uniref:PspC domain-containing protein n=1 Tax=Roseateles aquae TaxID=3077235 RepID=A0ABU3PH34_9BURK|nr:PspC domain-containing protein [Paucibacter sp. APW11]MDT9001881.1 PspC domain-containing protein [Paucibacter sp. APW11]